MNPSKRYCNSLIRSTLRFTCCVLGAFLFLFCTFPTTVSAQDSHTAEVKVLFRQGYSTLDTLYKNNGANLRAFVHQYNDLAAAPNVEIKSLVITGMTSPEGSYKLNMRLARKRAEQIAAYLKQQLRLDETAIAMDVRGEGVGWSMLEAAIEAEEAMPNRDEVLDIIRTTPELGQKEGVQVELRKSRLIRLNDGDAWHYIYENIFPALRTTGAQVALVFEERNAEFAPGGGRNS